MKKLISLVLAMSFLIVGCGPNKDEIKSSANTLLQGMKDVDFDKIKSLFFQYISNPL